MGSAAVPVRVRSLGEGIARLRLGREVPVVAGDTALLRDAGLHRILGRVTVLDTDPPPLRRRGAASARAAELADPRDDLVARRGFVRSVELRATGRPAPPDAVI